jgi:hypothetical protein
MEKSCLRPASSVKDFVCLAFSRRIAADALRVALVVASIREDGCAPDKKSPGDL